MIHGLDADASFQPSCPSQKSYYRAGDLGANRVEFLTNFLECVTTRALPCKISNFVFLVCHYGQKIFTLGKILARGGGVKNRPYGSKIEN
mgnify:CR=1 FL=1